MAWDDAFADYPLAGNLINAARLNAIIDEIKLRLSTAVANTPKRSILLSLAGGWAGTTLPDGGFVTLETSTNKVNFRGTLFAADASDEKHEFAAPMPKNWDGGTFTMYPIFYTTSTDASSHTIIFSLQAVGFKSGDAMDAAYGTPQTSTTVVASSIADTIHEGAVSAAITVAGTSIVGGNHIQWRISRLGADTFTGDVVLLDIMLQYTTDNYSDA